MPLNLTRDHRPNCWKQIAPRRGIVFEDKAKRTTACAAKLLPLVIACAPFLLICNRSQRQRFPMVQSISPANWPKGRNFQFVWPLRFDYGNGVKLGVCILAAAASLLLTGCVLKGKAQANVSSTPAPPKPAPAPPPPLSIPQTQAELPAPQPISPEALPTTPPEGPVEIQPAPRPLRRGAAFGPPKPETPPTLTVTD